MIDKIQIYHFYEHFIKVREEKNESPTRSVTTVKDVVVQYATQQELDKVVALQVKLYNKYSESNFYFLRPSKYLTPVRSWELSGSNITTKLVIRFI